MRVILTYSFSVETCQFPATVEGCKDHALQIGYEYETTLNALYPHADVTLEDHKPDPEDYHFDRVKRREEE